MQPEGSPRSVEVCFSPKLFSEILTKDPFTVVLVDILRATTSIVTAFENGVSSIIPVATLDEARSWKIKGFMVASEQDGNQLDFADFGNSAFSFTRERVEGKTLIYCTTNGTRALEITRTRGPVVMGAFINLEAVASWLARHGGSVVILCSGWKNKFCLEDSLFAGALSEALLSQKGFCTHDDSTQAAMDLWSVAKKDLPAYIEKASHRHRLRKLGLDDILEYSFKTGVTGKVPVFNGEMILLQDP